MKTRAVISDCHGESLILIFDEPDKITILVALTLPEAYFLYGQLTGLLEKREESEGKRVLDEGADS